MRNVDVDDCVTALSGLLMDASDDHDGVYADGAPAVVLQLVHGLGDVRLKHALLLSLLRDMASWSQERALGVLAVCHVMELLLEDEKLVDDLLERPECCVQLAHTLFAGAAGRREVDEQPEQALLITLAIVAMVIEKQLSNRLLYVVN